MRIRNPSALSTCDGSFTHRCCREDTQPQRPTSGIWVYQPASRHRSFPKSRVWLHPARWVCVCVCPKSRVWLHPARWVCVCVCVCERERERERERESARAQTYVCVLINNLPGTCSHIHNSRWVVCVYAYKCVCANINNLSGTCSHIQNSVCVLQNASCSILSLLFTVHCGPRMVPVRHCVSAFLPSCPSFD